MENRKPQDNPPDIYAYHDYRAFLTDLIQFKKKSKSGFSLRQLVKEAKISLGYLPMVLSGVRNLSSKALEKLAMPLGLKEAEMNYLKLLVSVSDADSQAVRLMALRKLQRSSAYKKLNPKEFEVYRYLTHWYYVAIRELAQRSDFRPDAKWIQGKLQYPVSLAEVSEALRFLVENEYIVTKADGTTHLKIPELNCVGGVYRVALAQFHREMLNVASDALELSVEARTVMGHTLCINKDDFPKIGKILNEALDRIAQLEKHSVHKDSVYQVTVAAFPLTKSGKGD